MYINKHPPLVCASKTQKLNKNDLFTHTPALINIIFCKILFLCKLIEKNYSVELIFLLNGEACLYSN